MFSSVVLLELVLMAAVVVSGAVSDAVSSDIVVSTEVAVVVFRSTGITVVSLCVVGLLV